jgi:hypothetical protein
LGAPSLSMIGRIKGRNQTMNKIVKNLERLIAREEKGPRPSWEHLPRSGTDLVRARTSRDFINIYNLTDDNLAFRCFMRRMHGWQSVLNCICGDHGRPNAY